MEKEKFAKIIQDMSIQFEEIDIDKLNVEQKAMLRGLLSGQVAILTGYIGDARN